MAALRDYSVEQTAHGSLMLFRGPYLVKVFRLEDRPTLADLVLAAEADR